MALSILWIVLGLAALALGGELLVRGAVGMAQRFRLTPAVIGLTIVAAGTSMPELVVSVIAALQGKPDIAIGNVIGSNIFNIGLVLGSTALFVALPAEKKTLRMEWPFLLLVTVVCLFIMRNGVIGRVEGALLFLSLVVFLWVAVRLGGDAGTGEGLHTEPGQAMGLLVFLLLAGFGLLIGGGKLVVRGASDIAVSLGISDRVIGITVVAMGTSLPELASSLVAAIRGRTDIAVGNIIGSSIFNLLGILGVGAMIRPMIVNPNFIRVDNWWLLGFTLALVPVFYIGRRRVSRADGLVLLALFTVYMVFVVRSS